ncbi:MAG: hypothetical protein ACOCXZ_03145 [Chloroflexota bacterium]
MRDNRRDHQRDRFGPRRHYVSPAPPRRTPGQVRLLRTLDALDAPGVLDAVVARPPEGLLVYGPLDFAGAADAVEWAGVVVWYRPPGYHNYHTLGLLGVWAQADAASTVCVGTRTLRFSAAHYNPESYFHHLKRSFVPYYGAHSAPPAAAAATDAILWQAAYTDDIRLSLRESIERVIAIWYHNPPRTEL